MEEQKATNVKMKAQKSSSDKVEQKLTYEQLNEACSQLYQQNQQMAKRLQQAEVALATRRMDYLFAVLKYEAVIKDSDFINMCVQEIKESLTIPEEDTKEN